MHLNLPEKLEAFAQQQVSEGLYSSTSEYMRELIRKDMQAKEEQRRHAFYAAVQVGDAQFLRGHSTIFDDTTMPRLREKAKQNVKNGTRTQNHHALPL